MPDNGGYSSGPGKVTHPCPHCRNDHARMFEFDTVIYGKRTKTRVCLVCSKESDGEAAHDEEQ